MAAAGHKLLALFDRAAARNFADVYVLARPFGKAVLLARAAQIDGGFDVRVLADMIATLDRFADDELPVPGGSSAAELRAFYAAWRSELAAVNRNPQKRHDCRCSLTAHPAAEKAAVQQITSHGGYPATNPGEVCERPRPWRISASAGMLCRTT